MKKYTGSLPWSLTTSVVLLIAGGGIWILMYIVSGMGLAAVGGGGGLSVAGYTYETRKNYTIQSEIEAPEGYRFTNAAYPAISPHDGNTIGFFMERRGQSSRDFLSLGIYNYVSGDHIYTYDYPQISTYHNPSSPRQRVNRLTEDAIYSLYLRYPENEERRKIPTKNANFCWDKHIITSGKTTTLCIHEIAPSNRTMRISSDGNFIIISGKVIDKGKPYELFIYDSETTELVKSISLESGNLNLEGTLNDDEWIFAHSYRPIINGSRTDVKERYILDFSQLHLSKTNEVPSLPRKNSLFSTKKFQQFRDFRHNPECASEQSAANTNRRTVICKTSFAAQ